MRIAYLCADHGIPVRGHKGASVHVREMVSALQAQGHAVRVFSPNPGTGNAIAAPLEVIGASGFPDWCARQARRLGDRRHPRLDKEVRELAYNVTLYLRVLRQLRRWRPDAIYERYSLLNLAGLVLARRLGVPHLLEVNAPLRLERARTKGLALGGMAELVEGRIFAGTDAMLVVSTTLRAYTLAHGARAARTTVQPNAVDTTRFRPGRERAVTRQRLGLHADAFVVGFAGSLKPWHGVGTLLNAFALLRADVPEARLLIAGEGPQGETLRAQVAGLGMDDAVIFTGGVLHDEMPDLLAAVDVGVAPYTEVPDFYFSPLKLYEYMASGLGVVASNVGEIAGLVRDGDTGLLCPPGDVPALAAALIDLARDPERRAALGVAAHAEAERHTWAANARLVTTLIERCIHAGDDRRAAILATREQ
jgi:glycosyltransferase involved in cell wall biosynthesis